MIKMRKKNVVAIIPARGGSKGLPGKNIKLLLDKPLIAYTIIAAKDAKLVDRVIVSTDDKEIANVAREWDAEVPFIRPKELATDNASSESVLKHAVEWLEKNENYQIDIVVYLQVTDIFRKRGMIDTVVKKLIEDPSLESAFVAYPTHKKFWKDAGGKFVRLTKKEYIPRQKAKPIYREDTGLACATRIDLIKKGLRPGDNVWILENPDDYSGIDIHDEKDLWLAEVVLKKEKAENNRDYYF